MDDYVNHFSCEQEILATLSMLNLAETVVASIGTKYHQKFCTLRLCIDNGVCVCSVIQMYLTLRNLMNYGPPGCFVYGIFQARILAWIAISQFKDQAHVSHWQADYLPLSPLGSPILMV